MRTSTPHGCHEGLNISVPGLAWEQDDRQGLGFPGHMVWGGKNRIQHREGVELRSQLRKGQEGGRVHEEAGKV